MEKQNIDWSNIGFGYMPIGERFVSNYKDGKWDDGIMTEDATVTMSECATMPDPDLIVRDNAYWLWFAVWNWDFIVKNGTTELSDAYTSFDMMKKVYNSDVIITRDELPDFNS